MRAKDSAMASDQEKSTEAELRDALRQSAAGPVTRIDTETVLRRVRARRIPKQFAASTVGVLAVAGIFALGVSTLPPLHFGQSGASHSDAFVSAPESMQDDATGGSASEPADPATLTCGSPAVAAANNSSGLQFLVDFPDSAPADGRSVDGKVTVANTGAIPVSGWLQFPATLSVSHDGIIVWLSNPVPDSHAIHVDLVPGQNLSYDAVLTTVHCTPGTSGGASAQASPLPPGSYDIAAIIRFIPDGAPADEALVLGGPVESIRLR